jgi:hypothetical protein
MPEPMDWRQLLSLLPMIPAAIRGGGVGMGSFGEGYARGRTVYDEAALRQRAQQAREAAETYAQSRDLVGDQRYEQERREAKQAQLMRLLEAMPQIGDRALGDAEAAGLLMPEQIAEHANKSVQDWVQMLTKAMPDLGADPNLLASAVGDIPARASARLRKRVEDIFPRLIEGLDERGLEQLRSNPAPLAMGLPFSEMERLYYMGVQRPAAASKLNAKQRYEQAVAAGDQAEAQKWLKVIQDESEATRVTVQAPTNEGTWTDTGRVNEKGEAIYINSKTFETRTQPYGAKVDPKADQERENKRKVLVEATNRTLNVLDDLLTKDGQLKPEARMAVGTSRLARTYLIPGTSAYDAQASIDRLKARMVTDLLAELKSQSRTGATGFGQVSEKELKILEDSAAKLNPGQSERVFTAELRRIRAQLTKWLETPTAPARPGGAAVPAVPGGGMITITDGKGQFFQAPAGTPIPAGYTKVGG